MIKFIFILSLFILTGISSSTGAADNYSIRTSDIDTQILQPDVSAGEMPVLQDLNEDENEMMLSLPCLHFINSLVISHTPKYSTAFTAADVIPRPPKL